MRIIIKNLMRFYDYVLHSNTSDADINIIVNTASNNVSRA